MMNSAVVSQILNLASLLLEEVDNIHSERILPKTRPLLSKPSIKMLDETKPHKIFIDKNCTTGILVTPIYYIMLYSILYVPLCQTITV